MKKIPSLQAALVLCLSLVLSTKAHADTVLYSSDFGKKRTEWQGRPGLGMDQPKLEIDTKHAKEKASPYLKVVTDGKTGCGFTLKPVVNVVRGGKCTLTFSVRTKPAIPLSYRITGETAEYGESSSEWHVLPAQGERWERVKYVFTPSEDRIGLDLAAGADHESAQIDLCEVEISGEPVAGNSTSYPRWLAIGDSITQHGPNEALRWTGDTRGMAASALDKDYVHLLQRLLQTKDPANAQQINVVGRIGKLSAGTMDQMTEVLNELNDWNADLITIQLGENDPLSELGAEGFEARYRKVVAMLLSGQRRPVIVCTGVWQPGQALDPKDSTRYAAGSGGAIKDAIIEKICRENKIPFASLAAAAADKNNFGTGQSEGVRWHPNDSGMRAYAESIFRALYP